MSRPTSHDVQSRPSRESWPHSHAERSRTISKASAIHTTILHAPPTRSGGSSVPLANVGVGSLVSSWIWRPDRFYCVGGFGKVSMTRSRDFLARSPAPQSTFTEAHRRARLGGTVTDRTNHHAVSAAAVPRAVDPVSIPHENEKRRVATGTNPEPNPQVDGLFVPSPQVTESSGSTSQGGDGFKSRWDYAGHKHFREF
jgi:hypothetical protein